MSMENMAQADRPKQTLLEQMQESSPGFVRFVEQTKDMIPDGDSITREEIERRLTVAFFMGYAEGVDSAQPAEEIKVKQLKRR